MGYQQIRCFFLRVEVIEFENVCPIYGPNCPQRNDGGWISVGDVGAMVLSDRKTMAEEGMVVLIIPKHEGDTTLLI